MRYFILMVALCQVAEAQSIVISGDRRSMVVSGRSDPVVTKPIVVEPVKPIFHEPVVTPAPVQVIQRVKTPRRYLAMFTGKNCGPCQAWKRMEKHKVTSRGYVVKEYEMTTLENSQRYSGRISRLPTFVVIDYETGAWLSDPMVGSTAAESLIPLLGEPTEVVSSQSTRQPDVSIQQPFFNTFTQGRFYQYGGRSYDLETYGRCSMRSCGMCAEIMAAKSRYFAAKNAGYNQTSVDRFAPGPQSSSPADVVDEAMSIMQLTPSDVLAELGCGDGLTAIRIARMTGCKVVGVEIDSSKVTEARENVDSYGLSDRITIIEGDVKQFRPEDHGITATYGYLYPELLAEITPQLSAGRITVCPGHKAEGLEMKLVGQCWVRVQS